MKLTPEREREIHHSVGISSIVTPTYSQEKSIKVGIIRQKNPPVSHLIWVQVWKLLDVQQKLVTPKSEDLNEDEEWKASLEAGHAWNHSGMAWPTLYCGSFQALTLSSLGT